MGYRSFQDATSGYENVVIGREAFQKATTSFRSVVIGPFALAKVIHQGSYNVTLGYAAQYENDNNAGHNTAIGATALYNNKTANQVAVGSNTLYNCSTGGYNCGIGRGTLGNVTTGGSNTGVGQSGNNITTGSQNVTIGYGPLSFNSGHTFADGSAVTNGGNLSQNVGIGTQSLSKLCTGGYNVGIGTAALSASKQHLGDTAIGFQSAKNLTGGVHNTFVG